MERIDEQIKLLKDMLIIYCIKNYDNDPYINEYTETLEYLEANKQAFLNSKRRCEDKSNNLILNKGL